MQYNTALCNAPSRKIFAPMFRARWQNMQNIINDSVFIDLVPQGYKTYYQAFIQQWGYWASGFVPQLHRSDFFSTGMGYTVCDIFTKECMSGGFRIESNNDELKAFLEEWSKPELNNVFNRMFFFSNAVGNAILVTTPVNGELYASAYPVNRVIFQIGRNGKISNCLILNRFIAGETVYYAREWRVMWKGKPYWCVELAKGTLVTSPTWNNQPISDVPDKIRAQWEYCYGSIKPSKWYRMPNRMRNIGCYNVRNKSVAVALQDLPGYSDSTLHTALDILYSIDYNYTQSQVDQYMGKSRALIPKQMEKIRRVDQPGTLSDGQSFRDATLDVSTTPLDEQFFTQIPYNNLTGTEIKPTFMQPDLRGEQHRYIRDSDLELLASKVGLSSSTLANHLAYNSSGTKTDDEITSENSTTEKSVGNKRELANVAINEMLCDVAYFYGYDAEADIQWGRSTTNSARENRELLEAYQNRTIPLKEFIKKRFPELKESEVEEWVKAIQQEQSAAERQDRSDSEFQAYLNSLNGVDNEHSERSAEPTGDNSRGSGDGNPQGGQG